MINYSKLNDNQLEAVQHIKGSSLIIAGAGSGKTTVITYRIAYLLEKVASPEEILAITFTNKATKEMLVRVNKLMPEKNLKKLKIMTFHGFCLGVLKNHIEKLSFSKNFSIFHPSDQKALIKEIINLIDSETTLTPEFFIQRISFAKNNFISPIDYKLVLQTDDIVKKVYQEYQNRLFIMNTVDLDDLLFHTYDLWQKFPSITENYQKKFRYVLVDEFQDTNYIQSLIVLKIVEKHQNICVVGDDDQSIYHWRGADVENILNFQEKFSDCKLIKLEENYRSTNNILATANHLISNNHNRYEKNLWSQKGDGEKVKILHCYDVNEEIDLVLSLISAKKISYSGKDIAILFRSNHQSRLLEQRLLHYNIPYTLVGGLSFYDRKEIRDTIAYLTLLFNSNNDSAFLRSLSTPTRGVGTVAIGKLRNYATLNKLSLFECLNTGKLDFFSSKAKKNVKQFIEIVNKYKKEYIQAKKSLANICYDYLADIGYLDSFSFLYKNPDEAEIRYENVRELLDGIKQYEEENNDLEQSLLESFIGQINLGDSFYQKNNSIDDDNKVILSTIHSIKGLEYSLVFIIGMEEGTFPSLKSINNQELDEERRLFYVAVTRAKEELILSFSHRKLFHGKYREFLPSCFLKELPLKYTKNLNKKTALPYLSRQAGAKLLDQYFN